MLAGPRRQTKFPSIDLTAIARDDGGAAVTQSARPYADSEDRVSRRGSRIGSSSARGPSSDAPRPSSDAPRPAPPAGSGTSGDGSTAAAPLSPLRRSSALRGGARRQTVAATKERELVAAYKQLFAKYDVDKSGTLEYKELRDIVRNELKVCRRRGRGRSWLRGPPSRRLPFSCLRVSPSRTHIVVADTAVCGGVLPRADCPVVLRVWRQSRARARVFDGRPARVSKTAAP